MAGEVFCVFAFDSTHQAIAAETAVTGLEGARLIPLPPEISQGCGLALRVNTDNYTAAAGMITAAGSGYSKAYTLTIQGSERTVVPCV